MVDIIIPQWAHLNELVKKADNSLVVCSPFYSQAGLDHLFQSLPDKTAVIFFTRLSPSDWSNKISDPEALLKFWNDIGKKGTRFILYIQQRLHAKAYAANERTALVGSANLSDGGFENNLEVMVRLEGPDALKLAKLINEHIKPGSVNLSKKSLRIWVESSRSIVIKARHEEEGLQAKKLSSAQRNLDKILRRGRRLGRAPRVSPKAMLDFVAWLKKNETLAGAKVLLARYDNSDGQNLTGHFKQCFYASMHFLKENPKLRSVLSKELGKLNKDDLYSINEKIVKKWIKYVAEHSTLKGKNYDYATLIGILPPSVGGTRSGGGGGISTLKRMLPLVGRFLL